ncbi:MAG: hypothetical protein O7H41_09980 [Planctomycetota bacterium]|nr:hypothetical protein [Planctomycetota bacterium]
MGVGKRGIWLFLGVGMVAVVMVQGCPGSSSNNRSDGRTLRIMDDSGRATSAVSSYDSVMVSLNGVEPRTHYDFVVTPAGLAAPVVGQARLTSDGAGNVRPNIILFDVGHDQGNVPVGSYDIHVVGPGLDETGTVDVELPSEAYVYTCDSAGEVKNTFDYGDPLYVSGGNFAANAEVHLTPFLDRPEWFDGDDVTANSDPTRPGGTQGRESTIANTDANGDLPVTQLASFFYFGVPGDGFDIVADLAPFDVFNIGSDAVDGNAVVGGTYQIPDVGTDIDSELACDSDGTYQDVFTTNDDVYAFINPPLQYVIEHGWVDKYVVNHSNEWQDGDALQDVSGGNEMDGVQSGCTNEQIVLVFPGPLPPGDYDIIIDINRDGVYTQGVDIVDGGSAESLGKVGFTVN